MKLDHNQGGPSAWQVFYDELKTFPLSSIEIGLVALVTGLENRSFLIGVLVFLGLIFVVSLVDWVRVILVVGFTIFWAVFVGTAVGSIWDLPEGIGAFLLALFFVWGARAQARGWT